MLFRRIVHQYVEPAKFTDCLLDGLPAEVFVSDITRNHETATALTFNHALGLLGIHVLVQIDNRDIGALFRIGNRHCTANSAIAAGDERHFITKFSASGLLGSFAFRLRRHRCFEPRLTRLVLGGALLFCCVHHVLLLSPCGPG